MTKQLGNGEHGFAYLHDGSDDVIKVVKISNEKEKESWIHEKNESEYCGKINFHDRKIAPEIKASKLCMDQQEVGQKRKIESHGVGLILMEKLLMVRGVRTREQDGNAIDKISAMSHEDQLGFIECFVILALRGKIHMDNHVENLGYLASEKRVPVLFDFGFIQDIHKTKTKDENVLFAIALSCFIVLENVELEEIDNNYFYKIGAACLFGTLKHKQEILNLEFRDLKYYEMYSKEAMDEKMDANRILHIKNNALRNHEEVHKINQILQIVFKDYDEEHDLNINIKVGALCSLFLLSMNREDRYSEKIYELFYHIRAGTFTFHEVDEHGKWKIVEKNDIEGHKKYGKINFENLSKFKKITKGRYHLNPIYEKILLLEENHKAKKSRRH